MDVKKSIEKNPMTYVVTCIIATVTLTAGVQQYFSSQQLNLERERNRSEISELNSRFASLRRGIPGSEFLDIRTLLYSPNSKANAPATSSTFFPENFYAGQAPTNWVYKETSELDVLADLGGLSLKGLPSGLQKATALIKFHLWKDKNEFAVEGHDFFKKIYAFVSVEKVTTPQLRSILGFAAEDDGEQAKYSTAREDVQKAIAKDSPDLELVDSLDKAFRGDLIGTFFTMQLMVQLEAALKSPKTNINLTEVQKVGNVLYAQFLYTLKDVKVGGRSYPQYYLRKELIVISTADGAYVVGTLVPSSEPAPRDPAFAFVSKWLDEFRVVIG